MNSFDGEPEFIGQHGVYFVLGVSKSPEKAVLLKKILAFRAVMLIAGYHRALFTVLGAALGQGLFAPGAK